MNRATLEKGLAACGGFLLGVLWMDLLFDTQLLRTAPETAVGTIATYYRHATTVATPMNRLIAAVMVFTVAASLYQLISGRVARGLAAVALVLAVAPIGLAALRVVPNAVQLGAQTGSLAEQVDLARGILIDHVLCLVSVAAFVAIEITARSTPDR
jgi:hypothetical protein